MGYGTVWTAIQVQKEKLKMFPKTDSVTDKQEIDTKTDSITDKK